MLLLSALLACFLEYDQLVAEVDHNSGHTDDDEEQNHRCQRPFLSDLLEHWALRITFLVDNLLLVVA